jgi:polar amino acid transport system substrate-binding protein
VRLCDVLSRTLDRVAVQPFGPALLLALTIATTATPASADEPAVVSGTAARPFVVDVYDSPPLAVVNPDKTFTGLGVEIWRRVADKLDIRYEMREVDRAQVHPGDDITVKVLFSLSPRSEEKYDMSHPYYSTGLAIATRRESGVDWRELSSALVSGAFLRGVGILALVVCSMGLAVWWTERRHQPEDFGGHALRGVSAGVVWTIESLFGKSKSLTRTAAGRILTLVWVTIATLLISGVTAKLSAEFTAAKLKTRVNGPQDLRKVKVGVVENSIGESYLVDHGISFKRYRDDEPLVLGLVSGEVDAVVGSEVFLSYTVNRLRPKELVVLPGTFRFVGLGVAFPLGTPVLKKFNRGLLAFMGTDEYRSLCARYLGTND